MLILDLINLLVACFMLKKKSLTDVDILSFSMHSINTFIDFRIIVSSGPIFNDEKRMLCLKLILILKY